MRPGQSSLEFLSYVALSSLVLAGLHGAMISRQEDAFQQQNKRKAEMVAEHSSFQVELALVYGDGYSRVFSVPSQIAGQNYTVEIYNGTSVVSWGSRTVFQPSRYRGEELNFTATGYSHVFRVVNDDGEVSISED